MNDVLVNFGLKRSDTDQCIYYVADNNKLFFVTVYVDDVLIFSNDDAMEAQLIDELSRNFQMKDLGEASSILGIRILHDRMAATISIDQSQYISDVLVRFGMDDCNPVVTPMDLNQKISSKLCPKTNIEQQQMKEIPYREAIGCLLFAAQITRRDISYAVNVLSRYIVNPGKAHWAALKRVLRYLKGTINKKLVYGTKPTILEGFCDADWASDVDERKSTTGYIFTMQGAAVSWGSRRQPTVALSSTEAEFMSLVSAMQEAMWLKKLERELLSSASDSIVLHCDNKGAIQLAINNTYSSRTKHIEIKASFIREKIRSKMIVIEYLPTDEQLADLLTKPMIGNKQQFFSKQIGLI